MYCLAGESEEDEGDVPEIPQQRTARGRIVRRPQEAERNDQANTDHGAYCLAHLSLVYWRCSGGGSNKQSGAGPDQNSDDENWLADNPLSDPGEQP